MPKGVPLSKQHKAKLKAAWERDPERRRIQSERQRKYRPSLDTRERLRQARLGKKNTLECRQNMSRALRGRRLSEEDKRRKSEAQKRHARLSLQGVCGCYAHRWERGIEEAREALNKRPLPPTNLEMLLETVILAEFPEVEIQCQFGVYRVDAYLPPPYHLAFEADGEHWHQHPKRDAARDAYLLRKFGLPVVRLTGSEIEEACVGAE